MTRGVRRINIRRISSLLLCGVITAALATGCARSGTDAPASAVISSAPAVSSMKTSEPSESSGDAEWFTFDPKVTSSFIKDIYGQTKCDAWFNLVDAVMAGEDTFECPDAHTYLWVMADYPNRCFPVMHELVDSVDNYREVEINGTAPIKYKVPKEEVPGKIEEFKQLVEDIINKVIKPEYNDFEKALALYNYFAETYIYDYDTTYLIENSPSKANYTSPYRLLTTKTGVCSEISEAYSYLLTQVGVEASVVSGRDHEWSIIKLGDNYYHIDPTYVLNDRYSLEFFLMTDEQRANEGGYRKKDFSYVGEYSPETEPDYSANDDSFSSMWGRHVVSFDPATKLLQYRVNEDDEHPLYETFDYSIYK